MNDANLTRVPWSRRRGVLLVSGAIVLAGVVWAGYWQLYSRYAVHTENAQIAGHRVTVMPRTTGTVVTIHVDDTDQVRRGDVLVELDDSDARVGAAAAEAQLAGALRAVARLDAERKRAHAAIALARTEWQRTATDLERRRGLSVRRAISAEELQHAEAAHATARSALAVAQQELAVTQATLGGGPLRAHPRVQAAAAALEDAYLRLARCRILAPADGQVAQRTVQLGQQVTPSSRLLDVVPLDALWVEANFKENQLAHLRLGQRVTITTDIYGARMRLRGRVQGVGAGTGSVFALLPPQNATGNWIKIVQRVPVRVTVDPDSLAGRPLLLGLSAAVTVDTRDRRGTLLTGAPADAARAATDIYAGHLPAARARVQALIAANLPQAE